MNLHPQVEQAFQKVFHEEVKKSFYDKELWQIKVLGKIIETRSGKGVWSTEGAAKRALTSHLRYKFKWKYDSITRRYVPVSLPPGVKQKDFTNWCIQNKLIEIVQIQ
jgi:hypothetical protein